jgi:serine protease inhibitor
MHPDTRVCAVNATYFKGRWSQEFDEDKTEVKP